MELNVIEGPYLRDIFDQPAALRRTLDGLYASAELTRYCEAFRKGAYRRVVLTGMGGSLFALHPLDQALTRSGAATVLVETSELIHYLPEVLASDTLLIAVSQSGESVEMLRLIEMARGKCPVIAVTNTSPSTLANRADATVLMHAGPEATVSCKTYVCTLLTLEWLRGLLTGEAAAGLAGCADAVADYLKDWRERVAEFVPMMDGVRHIFVTGRGSSIATARTAALVLKESAHFPAEGMSCAALRHGPFEMIGPGIFVMVMEGGARTSGLNRRLVDDVTASGARSVLVEAGAQSEESLRPIVEILPAQMLSLAIAARNGREAGRFERATKVTAAE